MHVVPLWRKLVDRLLLQQQQQMYMHALLISCSLDLIERPVAVCTVDTTTPVPSWLQAVRLAKSVQEHPGPAQQKDVAVCKSAGSRHRMNRESACRTMRRGCYIAVMLPC